MPSITAASSTMVTRTAGPPGARARRHKTTTVAPPCARRMLAAGAVIADRFVVERSLGHGGMGELTLVRDRALGERRVVLKRPRADYEPGRRSQCVASVRREGRALASFDHPGVVAVHDALTLDDDPALVLAFIGGGTLEEHPPLELRGVLRIGVELAGAVAHIHAHGWLHLDIKLENVLVTRDGNTRLIDFGISQPPGPVQPLMPGVTGVLGTPRVMSPEQVDGTAVDARSDVFSLGVLLHELIALDSPFPHEPFRLDGEVPPRRAIALATAAPGIPDALDALVNQMLETEPALRPPSAVEVGARLAAIARTLDSRAPAQPRRDAGHVQRNHRGE
jgi:serine/threonine-protein kinase